ncbi:uncharacterized protein LOC125657588 isoform X2 [Ostrea edulis]|uniref:uncharacterized protein LOC125657588 isoform X2 n=1 Tax=Ostrea edulis TaxID=37623 RepID=UPI0024AF5454|nr:uncharacterized protein LOC125657588 isoform X2 [Ostrea edulis]XP_056003665.1 uncharacterized protein LOC125657588 isoform X2 [Ostrea edulis]
MNRITLQACDGRSNRRCGQCLNGFYMAFRHDEECVSCENDRLNRSECKEYRKRPLTERTNPTTELSLDRDDRLAGNRKSVVAATHTEGKSDILTIVVLILMAGAIICVIVLVFVRNKRHHGSPVTDKGQANVWGNTSTKLEEINIEADCGLLHREIEKHDENGIVELSTAYDVVINREDPLLQRVAKQIDDEPKDIFLHLEVPRNVYFQTEKNIQNHVGYQIADVYHSLLQKWVERSGRAATKRVLYRAFEKFGMVSVCNVITAETEILK